MDSERLANLRVEYVAGQLSKMELCRKYGIKPQKLDEYSRKYGWVRNAPPGEDKIMSFVEKVLSDDPAEHAGMTAGHVVALHRKDVARLRSIASTLVDRLGLILSGQTPTASVEVTNPETGEITFETRPLVTLGARESPADLLEKLSRVMVRTTEIERQAYGMKHFNPGDEETEQALAEELSKLEEQLAEHALNKSQERVDVGNED